MNEIVSNSLKSVAKLVHTASEFTKENSPAIATALAIGGFITAAVLAATKTPEAVEEFEESGIESFEDVKEQPKETARIFIKHYWPSLGSIIVSTGLIIFADTEKNRRMQALAAAYRVSTEAYESLRTTVREELPAKKAADIEEKSANKIGEGHPADGQVVIQAKGGKTRFYDAPSGTWFYSDIDTIKRALMKLDAKYMTQADDVVWNDWRSELELPCIAGGDKSGWFQQWLRTNNYECPVSSLFTFGSKLDDDDVASITIVYPLFNKYGERL